MFFADGEIDSIVHDNKIFIDFTTFVEHYLISLALTHQETQPFDEITQAQFEVASIIGETLLNTLELYELNKELETL